MKSHALISYYDQLRAAAFTYKVDLRDAARIAGVADTTVARWEAGQTSPRYAVAASIFRAMQRGRKATKTSA